MSISAPLTYPIVPAYKTTNSSDPIFCSLRHGFSRLPGFTFFPSSQKGTTAIFSAGIPRAMISVFNPSPRVTTESLRLQSQESKERRKRYNGPRFTRPTLAALSGWRSKIP